MLKITTYLCSVRRMLILHLILFIPPVLLGTYDFPFMNAP